MTGNYCFLNILNQNRRYANKYLGGCIPGSVYDDILEFNPLIGQWELVNRMRNARCNHAVSVINVESGLCDKTDFRNISYKRIVLLEEGKDFLYRPSLSHTRLYRLHIIIGRNNTTLTLTLYREIIDMIFCCHIVALSSDIDHNMLTRIVKR